MSDNVIKFRRPEKKPEPKSERQRGPVPRWVPFVALFAVALIIFFVQRGVSPV
jgi:hypothetical protein